MARRLRSLLGVPTSLRGRFLAWLLMPLLLIWILSTWVDYQVASRTVGSVFDRALLSSALDLARQVRATEGRVIVELPPIARDIIETDISERLYYRVVDSHGQTVFGLATIPYPATEITPGEHYFFEGSFEGGAIRGVVVGVQGPAEAIEPAASIIAVEPLDKRRRAATEMLISISIPQFVLIVTALVLVLVIVRRALAPLGALAAEIGGRPPQDLAPLREAGVPAEVLPLVRALNEMLGRLKSVLDSQQRFIADAAHQLRTPLAGIRTQTELALRQGDLADIRRTLGQLMRATEHTTHLVNQLLALARSEPGVLPAEAFTTVDLATLARDVTTLWVPRALARDIDLGYDGPDAGVAVRGDAFLLHDLLGNLLDNAVRYTQTGGNVTVRLTEGHGTVALYVEDNGPGIPAAERERVFERFHRVLGTGTEGAGLGLAIVREIADRHGAQIEIGTGPGDAGTRVRVTFARPPGHRKPPEANL